MEVTRRERGKSIMAGGIPMAALTGGGGAMPVIGLGTSSYPPAGHDAVRSAILDAMAVGYRHFDTASLYNTERPLGEAIAEGLHRGLINSRDEIFVTSKLWCTDAHPHRVLPALRQSLRDLQLEYLDLYLVHWPVSLKPTDEAKFPIDLEGALPIDITSVWKAMEECHRLGLAKLIGVSNFSCKKLDQVLKIAKIPPAVNQVEMHPLWQQKKLIDFCKEKSIQVTAYSPLGGNGTPWGFNNVIDCAVLKEIATARGKTVAQVSLRWIYQQGAALIVKSFKPERMKENKDIFDWELSEEELSMISRIPQSKGVPGDGFASADGPFKSLEELWDGEI